MKIIELIKNFFIKLKENKKIKMIDKKSIISHEDERETLKKDIIKIGINETIEIQRRLEKKQISINSLNIFEIMDLIEVYEKQIIELKANTKKT